MVAYGLYCMSHQPALSLSFTCYLTATCSLSGSSDNYLLNVSYELAMLVQRDNVPALFCGNLGFCAPSWFCRTSVFLFLPICFGFCCPQVVLGSLRM